MKTVFGSALLGVVAYWLARGVGIAAWTTWTPGDAIDIGAFVFVGALYLATRRP